jgi:hypothetical protein
MWHTVWNAHLGWQALGTVAVVGALTLGGWLLDRCHPHG